jgi:hypothetical protein
MQTKQNHIKAVLTSSKRNAINYSGEKETVQSISIVCRKTEKPVLSCHVYMGRSRSASTVYASLWLHNIKEHKLLKKHKGKFYSNILGDETGEKHYQGNTSGKGRAGGYGYCKTSAAIQEAITSAGIEFYGSPYPSRPTNNHKDMTKKANIAGTGCHRWALLAIAYAAGYSDCVVMEG